MRPEDVGIAVGHELRRVRGLRRAEVAVLAGISTEYYLRLEQGRETRPSVQVLNALARALQLDDAARTYMRELGEPRPNVPAALAERVPADVQWLIDSWPHTAAMIHNRYLDVLATNALARALSPSYRVGRNTLVSLLTDPYDRDFHEGWDRLSARSAALLRSMFGRRADDARLAALVAELSAVNPHFREAWERNDVTSASTGSLALRHPQVGRMVLRYARLALPGTDGQTIWLYQAEPNSPSTAALGRLVPAGSPSSPPSVVALGPRGRGEGSTTVASWI